MAKKTTTKKRSLGNTNEFSYFLIKTKGYKKQFTNRDSAQRKFASLEKAKMEQEEPFKIELFAKTSLKTDWIELDFVQVSDFE